MVIQWFCMEAVRFAKYIWEADLKINPSERGKEREEEE
jgi:hypothetical protein